MSKKINFALEIILDNFKMLIPLQIINQLFGVFIIYPISGKILNFAYQYSGQITILNIDGFHLSLENIILFSTVFIIRGLYYFFVLSTFIVLADNLIKHNKSNILDIFKSSLNIIKSNLSIEIVKLALIISIVMPLSILGILNSAIIQLKIPEFILDYFKYSDSYIFFAIIGIVLINIYALFITFVMYDVLINKYTLTEAHAINVKFVKANISKIGTGLIIIAIAVLLLLIGYIVSTLTIIFFIKYVLSFSDSLLVFNEVHSVLLFLFKSTFGIILLSLVIMLVITLKRNSQIDEMANNSMLSQSLKLARNFLFLSVVLSVLFTINRQVNLQINEVEVIGHRTGVLELPENSLLGLQEAINREYDMVEIDVQQLKDKSILVVHDPSFSRLGGSKKKVVDSTYEEVLLLDPTYTHPGLNMSKQKFATLADMLEMAKDEINIMIEVKTNKEDDNFLQEILAEIEKYDIMDQVELASMDKTLLKEIKSLNSEISTTYIATAVIGDKLNDDYIDNYSLQLDLVTTKIISKIKNQNKKVYIWTPNTSKTINKALDLDIDGIVTDKPDLVKFYIKNPNYSAIDEFWQNQFFHSYETTDGDS